MQNLLNGFDEKFLNYHDKEACKLENPTPWKEETFDSEDSKIISFGRAVRKLVAEPFTKAARIVQVSVHTIGGIGYLLAAFKNEDQFIKSKREFKIALVGTLDVLKTPVDLVVKVAAILISPISPEKERGLNRWVHEQSVKIDALIAKYKNECETKEKANMPAVSQKSIIPEIALSPKEALLYQKLENLYSEMFELEKEREKLKILEGEALSFAETYNHILSLVKTEDQVQGFVKDIMAERDKFCEKITNELAWSEDQCSALGTELRESFEWNNELQDMALSLEKKRNALEEHIENIQQKIKEETDSHFRQRFSEKQL